MYFGITVVNYCNTIILLQVNKFANICVPVACDS